MRMKSAEQLYKQMGLRIENLTKDVSPFCLPRHNYWLLFWSLKKNLFRFFQNYSSRRDYLFDWGHLVLNQNLANCQMCEKASFFCLKLFTWIILTWSSKNVILASFLMVDFPADCLMSWGYPTPIQNSAMWRNYQEGCVIVAWKNNNSMWLEYILS